MNWGDIPAWFAIALSLAASVGALIAKRRAEAAQTTADASLRRIADVMEQQENRATPLVSFKIESGKGSLNTLRNVGKGAATGFTIDTPGLTYLNGRPPDVLIPNQGLPFHASQEMVVTELIVRCNELPGPIAVPLPHHD
jgi:hypothetical protein